MRISIPYHNGFLHAELDEALVEAVIVPKAVEPQQSPKALVKTSLENPICSKRLCEKAKGKHKITLITCDHTRAMPSKVTLPLILEELRKGNPNAEITILVATGLHRPTTSEELYNMFGAEIVQAENILVSDAYDETAFVDFGRLPSGAPFELHKAAAECDLLISEGFIEPHFFAGYSGGRKSVLPGVCSLNTIKHNHAYTHIADKRAATGVLKGNPLHEDMLTAAKRAKLAFILNVTLDSNKRITAAFSGEFEKAHGAGVSCLKESSRCPLIPADIVITGNGGYPLDQNLYQTAKAASTAALYAKKDGVIILCAACKDGLGGEQFAKVMSLGTPDYILSTLSKLAPEDTILEQWNAQIYAQVLKAHTLILVTDMLDYDLLLKMNIIPAASISDALKLARKLKGEAARIVILPDGVAVIPDNT